jgi:hypothetical protein
LTLAAPNIDGVLDDAAWKDAATSKNLVRSFGAESDLACSVKIMQDEKHLYVAIICQETESHIKRMKAVVDRHDGAPIWEDDEVEVFLDPSGTRAFPYYQFIVNTRGTTFDVYVKAQRDFDKTWEPQYEAKVNVNLAKNEWTFEMALPWSAFDRSEKSAAQWGFNVLHVRSVGEVLYFAPVYGERNHSPWLFGLLKGMPERDLKAK